MENVIKNYFINKKVVSKQQEFAKLKKLNISNSKKYQKAVNLLNHRLKAYQEDGKLSYYEAEILCHLFDKLREETIEVLKVDIFTHIITGANNAMSEIKGAHNNG